MLGENEGISVAVGPGQRQHSVQRLWRQLLHDGATRTVILLSSADDV